MAQRALLPDGVELHQNDLVYEQTARVDDHEQALLDQSDMGVVSGGVVTVNGVDATRIDVAACTGYSPRGDYVVLNPGQSSVQLSSGVLGTVNLVCLFYTELQGNPVPHEANGTSPMTRAARSSRLRVYTQAEFNALATSNDLDLSADTQDRALILALVTGTGGPLTAGSIESPTAFNTINYATQPTNISGVTIGAVSSTTAEGTGTLTFTFVGLLLTWQAPGEVAGAPVAVGGGGAFVLTSGGGTAIAVTVIAGSLPVANQSDSIIITNLYSQDVARFTAVDGLHRSMLGTGTPTPTNPHGLALGDLGGLELAELIAHQDIQHSNGIWRGSSTAALAISINELAAPDELVITAPAGVDTYYVDGVRLSSILNTTIDFGAAPANAVLYEVVVDDEGTVSLSARATWPNPRAVTGVEIIDVSDGTTVGAKSLVYASALQLLSWDGGPTVAVGAGGWFKLVASNDRDSIDVFVIAVSLPGADQTDAITIGALASTDAFLRLAMVCWTGSATGFLGWTPSRGIVAARTLDKRLYGTTDEFNFHDEDLRAIVPDDGSPAQILRRTVHERNLDELRASGVLVGYNQSAGVSPIVTPENNSLRVTSAGGLNVNVAGGIAYIFGERVERVEQTTIALTDNATNWVYLDLTGTLQVSTALTFSQIIGTGTINSQGRGIVLAKVITVAGAITSLLDYRRNIFRLDNLVGSLTVGSSTNGARNRCQFFSLQAAVEYAGALGIQSLHITSSVSDVVSTTISLSNPLRVTCDPGITVALSGTAVKFTISGGGALEWIGGDLTISGADFIVYNGNASSWVLLRDAEITVSNRLFTNTTSTSDARGFRVEGCNIDRSAGGLPMVYAQDSWSSQLVFENCAIDCGADIFYSDLGGLAGAETIANVHVHGCEVVASFAFYGDGNATWNDWVIRDNRFTVSTRLLQHDHITNRFLFEGNQVDRGAAATAACIILNITGTTSALHTGMRILNNAFSSTLVGPTGGYFDSHELAGHSGLKIIGNSFGSVVGGTQGYIHIRPLGSPGCEDIEIAENSMTAGRIVIGSAGGDAITQVHIRGNIIEGTNGDGIDLIEGVQRFTIADNTVEYSSSYVGIKITSAGSQQDGTIANNHVRTTSGTSSHGIWNLAPNVVISGNTIRQPTDSTAPVRAGINQEGTGCVVTGNSIYTAGDGAGAAGILNQADNVTISGNYIQLTAAAPNVAAGISSGANDVAITGNTVVADAATAAMGLQSIGDRVCITGNRLPATGGALLVDVTATGFRQVFVGNVVANGAVTGEAIVGAGGGDTSSVGMGIGTAAPMNVCTVTLNP